MDRYDQMDVLQVRDVMLTTASHTNPDGSKFEGWTAGEGQVDVRYGWGMPDLDKGMYGLVSSLVTSSTTCRATAMTFGPTTFPTKP